MPVHTTIFLSNHIIESCFSNVLASLFLAISCFLLPVCAQIQLNKIQMEFLCIKLNLAFTFQLEAYERIVSFFSRSLFFAGVVGILHALHLLRAPLRNNDGT